MKIENYIVEIVEQAGERLNRGFDTASLSALPRPVYNKDVSDSAGIYTINGKSRRHDSVLFVSNPKHPAFVSEAVAKIALVCKAVSPQIRAAILQPDFHDFFGAQSFAVFPRLQPMSGNKLVRGIQKRHIEKSINGWLGDLSNETIRPVASGGEMQEFYIEPLTYLIDESQISDELRQLARTTLAAIHAQEFQPVCVIQHGDFWLDNILLNRGWPFGGRDGHSFWVIDWGGANLKGYPFIDFLRYALSATRSKKRIADSLNDYCARCGIPPNRLVNYVCANIGWFGLNRNNFPMDRYVSSSEKLYQSAKRLIGTE